MPPLADAMRFVDDKALQQVLGVDVRKQTLQRLGRLEFLWGHVQKFNNVSVAFARDSTKLSVPVAW